MEAFPGYLVEALEEFFSNTGIFIKAKFLLIFWEMKSSFLSFHNESTRADKNEKENACYINNTCFDFIQRNCHVFDEGAKTKSLVVLAACLQQQSQCARTHSRTPREPLTPPCAHATILLPLSPCYSYTQSSI